MNYLAHLHIADHTQTSLLGNLLGDFVKGSHYSHYPQALVEGIALHRLVDSYIDNHPKVLNAKRLFEDRSRRFSGIALDMLWDHFLAVQWQVYHTQSLDDFCTHCERDITKQLAQDLPASFLELNGKIWRQQWLQSYQSIDNVEFALEKISQRSPRLGRLTECFPYISRHYDQLNECFLQVYPDVLNAAKTATNCR